MWILLMTIVLCHVAEGNYPVFDYRTRMRVLLLPAEIRPGTVVYRLRGTDSDYNYPLRFSVADDVGKSIIRIENMPCTPTHTYCQANVILARKLEAGRVYDLVLSLKDASGRETKVDCMVRATRGVPHFDDAFPYVPNVLMIPENTPVGTVLDFVLARKNPQSPQHAYLELWGSEKFRIVQNLSTKDLTNGSITLTGALDFEDRNMYMLQIFALDPYTEPGEDTRNIAGFQLAVIVEDDQDMAPIFHSVPPVTKLPGDLRVGQKILQIRAEDGDRGSPREIRYGFSSENNPFAEYFNISEMTGDIILAKPLRELAASGKLNQPVVLTVMANEVKTNLWEPAAMSSTTQVAFILEKNATKTPPYFSNNHYVSRIPENSPQGTPLLLGEAYAALIRGDDFGKDGVFSLELENNNGTFEISPAIGERKTNFMVRVRNNEMLDFEERSYVTFGIVAKELSTEPGDLSKPMIATANVTAYIDDENDNPPEFLQGRYEAVMAENVTAGYSVAQVQATDKDTGLYGKVFYTNVLGSPNGSLTVDPTTGVVTVATNNHGFDREAAQEFKLMVEARDMEGTGNRADVPLVIKLLDVNDETPQFERQVFEFILQPNLRNFTSRAFVRATDADAEEPNNLIRYEIMSGNYENKFYLDEVTGELFIRSKLTKPQDFQDDYYNGGSRSDGSDGGLDSAIGLTVRAYDLGIPHRWQHAHVRIYPPESKARTMSFIVPGSNPDKKKVEELLQQITGGRVIIQDIKPYTGQEPGTDVTWRHAQSQQHTDKSVVTATVFYDGNSYVDVNQLETRLTANKTQSIVNASVTEYRHENRILFWFMIFFLILLFIILLILILCCIWQGCCACPCLVIDRKRIVSPTENIKFIAHERESYDTKGVQAVVYSGRREAWSGRGDERLNHTKVTNVRETILRPSNLVRAEDVTAAAASYVQQEENGGPNVIYTKEFIKKQKQPTMLVEDVEIDPYNTQTLSMRKISEDGNEEKLQVSQENDPDSDSMRRHELERGSDVGKSLKEKVKLQKEGEPSDIQRIEIDRGIEVGPDGIKQYRLVLERPKEADDLSEDEIIDLERENSNREQYYIRDGNAEILRLVTRGNQDERPRTMVPDKDKAYLVEKGKEILMRRFMEDQKQSVNLSDDVQQELLRQLQRAYDRGGSQQNRPRPDGSDLSEYVAQLLYQAQSDPSLLRDTNPNLDIDNRGPSFNLQNQETQSLPGQMEISTQTERDFATQTEELSAMRPPRRKARSDNEFSDDDGYDEFYDYEDGKWNLEKAVTALNLGKGWVKRSNNRSGRFKKPKRYKIKTPILEEADSPNETIKYDTRPHMFKMPEFSLIVNGSGPGAYTENKSSILRRRKMKERITEEAAAAKAEDDLDIQKREKGGDSSEEDNYEPEKEKGKARKSRKDTMDLKKIDPETIEKMDAVRRKRAESLNRLYEAVRDLQNQEMDSLKVESRERTASLNRVYTALRELQQADLNKSRSLMSLNKEPKSDGEDQDEKPRHRKGTSPMGSESSRSKRAVSVDSLEEAEKKDEDKTEANAKRKHSSNKRQKLIEKIRLRESVSEPPKAVAEDQDVEGSVSVEDLPKNLKSKQSKYMDWYKELNEKRAKKRQSKKKLKKVEDDLDSGIAMSQKQGGKAMPLKKNQQFLEKKSIFTIAYDEVQTKNIRPDTNASQKY